MITSNNNPQVRTLVRLFRSPKERKEKGLFLVEGAKMVKEAIREGRITKAYYSETYYKEHGYEQGVMEYDVLKDSVFRHISMTMTPQGVMGMVKIPVATWEEVSGGGSGRLLILENVNDPGNLGTMLRTAEGAGFGGVVMSKDTVDAYNPKAVRATMGSILRMPLIDVEDLADALRKLKGDGFTLYAADLKGGEDYDKVDYGGKIGIVIGNEANGLRPDTLDVVQRRVRIPMHGRVESLNAAVAAALLMYEARKRD